MFLGRLPESVALVRCGVPSRGCAVCCGMYKLWANAAIALQNAAGTNTMAHSRQHIKPGRHKALDIF